MVGNPDCIHIHKHVQTAEQGSVGTGALLGEDAKPKGDPLPGVTFAVQRIDAVDLRTNAGWEILKTLQPGAANVTGEVKTETTNSEGEARFGNLPVGAYLVKETNKPENVIASIEPFIVTVPRPLGAAGEWVYDVHTYPKNTVSNKPVKTVDDSNAFVNGDPIYWTVKQQIPFVARDSVSEFQITDFLDTALELRDTAVRINGVPVTAGVTVSEGQPEQAGNVRASLQDYIDNNVQKNHYDYLELYGKNSRINNGDPPVNDATILFNFRKVNVAIAAGAGVQLQPGDVVEVVFTTAGKTTDEGVPSLQYSVENIAKTNILLNTGASIPGMTSPLVRGTFSSNYASEKAPRTEWGGLNIIKYDGFKDPYGDNQRVFGVYGSLMLFFKQQKAVSDEEAAAARLGGAVFEVYKGAGCKADQKLDIDPHLLTTSSEPGFKHGLLPGSDVTMKPGYDRSNKKHVEFPSFRAGVVLKAGEYSVKEVQAPAGYVLPLDACGDITIYPGEFTNPRISNSHDGYSVYPTTKPMLLGRVDTGSGSSFGAPSKVLGLADTNDVLVPNEKSAVPGLPLTGAQGQLLITITGAGLLLAGFAAVMVMRRNRKNEDAV